MPREHDIAQVDEVARAYGMSRRQRFEFGDFLEDEKATGSGGTKNRRGDFTMKELREKRKSSWKRVEVATRQTTPSRNDVSASAPWIAELEGQAFLRAAYAYGGELRLHFGRKAPYDNRRLASASHGAWVLSLRATSWVLAGDGVILSRSHDEQQHALRHFGHLEGKRVAQTWLRRSDAAITVRFEDGPSFMALTDPPWMSKKLDLWELLTPRGDFLVAHNDGSLTIEDGAAEASHALGGSPRNVHTIPHGAGWANKREGSKRVSNTAPTKALAEVRGREMARRLRGEHLIHREDGSIAKSKSYAKEPRPPKDRTPARSR